MPKKKHEELEELSQNTVTDLEETLKGGEVHPIVRDAIDDHLDRAIEEAKRDVARWKKHKGNGVSNA